MTRDRIFEVICQQLAVVVEDVDAAAVDEAKSMKEYGADSLEMVEVVSRTMKVLGIRVPRTELAGLQSISDLVDVFERHAVAAPVAA